MDLTNVVTVVRTSSAVLSRRNFDAEAENLKRVKLDEVHTYITDGELSLEEARDALIVAQDEYDKTCSSSWTPPPPSAYAAADASSTSSTSSTSSELALVPSPPSSSTTTVDPPLMLLRDSLLLLNTICLLFVALLQHDPILVESTLGSSGDDLRFQPLSSLAVATAADVALVGKCYYRSIVSSSSRFAAMEEYIQTFLSIQEIDESCQAFRFVMEQVAMIIFFQTNSFLASLRLYFGAGLSVLDMISDLIMISKYFENNNSGFAFSIIAMLSLNICGQIFLATVQQGRNGAKALLLEVFYIVTCLAPGVHAFRVARGEEAGGSEKVDHRTMLMMAKSLELVFEAIPGLVIQLFAFLTLARSSPFALVSIGTSAATTSFSVAVMYFDNDVDPTRRKGNPFFYGVFPEDITARSQAFFWLFMFSVAHVLSKGFCVSLLWATFDGMTVFIYYGAELILFFSVKLARRDLVSWVPVKSCHVNFAAGFCQRLANKVMIDFTGFLQMRHAYDAGGLHYTLSLLWSQISAVISAVLYLRYFDKGDTRASKISATVLYSTVGSLVLVWAVSFYCFIKKINPKYHHSFFGTMTGPEFCVHMYQNGTDEMKRDVFSVNVLYWKPIRGEVKAHIHANWDRWSAEQPDWFTDRWIAAVPDEFLPRTVDDDLEQHSSSGLGQASAKRIISSKTLRINKKSLMAMSADEIERRARLKNTVDKIISIIKRIPLDVSLDALKKAREKREQREAGQQALPHSNSSNLPTSTDALFKASILFVLISTIVKHEANKGWATIGSNGQDLHDATFSELTAADAGLIGKCFFAVTVMSPSPDSAVEGYILDFRALRELDELCPAFRMVMNEVALVLYSQTSTFGANFRLYFGAGLSITDMFTDATMIVNYFEDQNIGFAKAMIIMLSLNMLIQLLGAFFQSRKRGTAFVLLEMIYIITCVAPGVHAFRVASSQEKLGSETVDGRTMLLWSKIIEIVFEAVPGLIIQLFAYFTLVQSSSFALVSIAISAMTTAFSVSVMFFDKDVDPRNRRTNPFFYGVFLDDVTSRTHALFWLFVFSASHVLSKGVGVALFWTTFGGDAVFAYYGAELLAFFAVKVVRQDMIYWPPVQGLAASVALSGLVRFANKVRLGPTPLIHHCQITASLQKPR